jgi:hypothetical protein
MTDHDASTRIVPVRLSAVHPGALKKPLVRRTASDRIARMVR